MKQNKPAYRKLRGYAFDPSLSVTPDTAGIASITYKVRWEDLGMSDDGSSGQGPGPIGEYLEIIDYDPTIEGFYVPVDLNDPYLLAQDGLSPSEGNPQFHQQMVYAVAMTTIENFERALGRKILWAPRRVNEQIYYRYVQRLRLYPHALREANAYYSPLKKALLFGYFSAVPSDISLQMPGSLVFTCLSHDIIAHEITHAIIDGMHKHYNMATNPDVLAFHEAFSDLIALFQHFSFPEVLKNQIAKTKGDLSSQNLLGKLAQQFGTAIGHYGSLRDAIGQVDPQTGRWSSKEPSVEDYASISEPHARGSILVAAVFEAFINIYKSQAADLLRIASGGTGILPQGELHPDLVNRLASEAARTSGHVLQMCIRALDYCPPVDITFGDFLRAVITADLDLVADDNRHYRLYFIDAFRKRGIYPKGIKTLSVDSLSYPRLPELSNQSIGLFDIITTFLREYRNEVMYRTNREEIYNISNKYSGGIKGLHKRLLTKFEGSVEFELLTGIVFSQNWQELGIHTSTAYRLRGPSFQIQNLRLVSRVGPDNVQINQIIFSIVQRSGIIIKNGQFDRHFCPEDEQPEGDFFELFGGCTLIFDLDSLRLKYFISRPLLDIQLLRKGIRQIDRKRISEQYAYRTDTTLNSNGFNEYFNQGILDDLAEPFSFLHQH